MNPRDSVTPSNLRRGLQLGGEQRRLTILMADLRGFTTLSESLPPEQIVRLLNVYLAAMSEVITEHGGTIDEFIGDAILVLFGAPLPLDDHARSAVACALRMQQAMSQVNRHIQKQDLPEVQIGIGINTGEVVVGNIGSERRAKYGVVGHHVNLTARIESQTRGGQILISEETRNELGNAVQVGCQLEVALKGLEGAVQLFEVRDLIDTAASSPTITEQMPDTKRGLR